ncbi:MAG: bifunctional adenosylcobinamide kinase/adenosylcobinamide-phosphate guanylyltransferase [Oscillospiraceae bacterium]|nr:bifunctional adenosylcobinamide kinase/adenosylcobinamide-phosphate guanylyltransferase [Oscillospiraceae bacterium]
MMILVTGGSKCGKSHYAESLFEQYTDSKYYIATMQPYGEEAHAAIFRHRKMRAEKHFQTVEQYTDIDRADVPEGGAALLECMGNLLANEMFCGDAIQDCADKITADILCLHKRLQLLVIVTNQVGSDGFRYEKGTSAYIAALGKINQALAAYADSVVECVYGIPLVLKG